MTTKIEGSSLHSPLPYDVSSCGETDLKNDVSQLAIHSMTDGYMEGNNIFYVALQDNHGHTNDVTPSMVAKWSTEWKMVNEKFKNIFLANDDLRIFFK